MTEINASRFEGSLKELSIYHLAIIDSTGYVKLFTSHSEEIQKELLIRNFETDAACSWCVVESVKRAFPEIQVIGHELNDRYEAVYDTFFLGEENIIRRKLMPYLEFQKKVKTFKVMCLLDKTIVAIGT